MATLDTTMLLKLSSEQKDAMQEAAEKLGLSSSELVRLCMEMCVQWVDEGKVRVVDGELTMAGALRREVLKEKGDAIGRQVEKAVKAYESVQRVFNDPKTQKGIGALVHGAEEMQRVMEALAPRANAIQQMLEEREGMMQRLIEERQEELERLMQRAEEALAPRAEAMNAIQRMVEERQEEIERTMEALAPRAEAMQRFLEEREEMIQRSLEAVERVATESFEKAQKAFERVQKQLGNLP